MSSKKKPDSGPCSICGKDLPLNDFWTHLYYAHCKLTGVGERKCVCGGLVRGPMDMRRHVSREMKKFRANRMEAASHFLVSLIPQI
jgi:hypothetical protein